MKRLLTGFFMSVLVSASTAAPSMMPAATMASDAATGGAQVYYTWLNGNLTNLKNQLPDITRSAEAAARIYVQDSGEIESFGDEGIVGEATGRAGGLMGMSAGNHINDPKWKGIVLLFPRDGVIEKDLALAAKSLQQSKMVVVFGRHPVLEAATNMGLYFSAFIETSPSPYGGVLMTAQDRRIIPSDPIANIAALWVWTGEFVAACTRLGKMPPIYQSFAVPGAKERAAKFKGLKFHVATPRKIDAGRTGMEYIQMLQSSLAVLYAKELDNIRNIAAKAVETTRSGHVAYVSATGHAIIHHLSLPYDPGCFHPLSEGWSTLKKNARVEKGDFIYCLGYDGVEAFADVMALSGKTGAVVAWSMTDYKNDPGTGRPPGIANSEIFVNQRWALGDAVVTIPGYDIKMLPSSGVLAEASLRMVEAEMVTMPGSSFNSRQPRR